MQASLKFREWNCPFGSKLRILQPLSLIRAIQVRTQVTKTHPAINVEYSISFIDTFRFLVRKPKCETLSPRIEEMKVQSEEKEYLNHVVPK